VKVPKQDQTKLGDLAHDPVLLKTIVVLVAEIDEKNRRLI